GHGPVLRPRKPGQPQQRALPRLDAADGPRRIELRDDLELAGRHDHADDLTAIDPRAALDVRELADDAGDRRTQALVLELGLERGDVTLGLAALDLQGCDAALDRDHARESITSLALGV